MATTHSTKWTLRTTGISLFAVWSLLRLGKWEDQETLHGVHCIWYRIMTSDSYFNLPLPWKISHPINKFSPLYGLTKREMIEQECEVIIIFDVIDELSSKNFQV